MKLKSIFVASCAALCTFNVAYADQIDAFHLEPNQTRYLNPRGLDSNHVYAVSCGSTLVHFSAKDDIDTVSIHVNPGEVTDRHGRHGANPDYEFPAPIGSVSFYAQPDSTGVIDFNVSNTTQEHYFIFCNINFYA